MRPLILIALAYPTAVRGGGYWNLDRGASLFARGGANFAGPEDPNAIYANPAGLAGLRGLQLQVDLNALFDHRGFARTADALGQPPEDRSYAAVTNQFVPLPPSPGLFAAYNFGGAGLEELTVGLAVYGPIRYASVYPDQQPSSDPTVPDATCVGRSVCQSPQRYSMVRTSNLQVHYGLSAAYELPWRKLRLGGTFTLTNQTVGAQLKLNAPIIESPSNPEDQDWDVDADLQATAQWIPGGIVGISAQPLPWLVVGASYQIQYDVEASGTGTITLGPGFEAFGAIARGDQVDMQVHMPGILRVAAKYVDPALDFELAVAWEDWSRNDAILISPRNIEVVPPIGDPMPIQPLTVETRWVDAYSVRLGSSFELVAEVLEGRAGAFFESAAVPKERLSAGGMDMPKIGGAIGGRVDFGFDLLPFTFWLDAAAGVIYWFPVEVTDSRMTLKNPLQPDLVKHPITNGRYTNTQVLVFLALGAQIPI